MKTLILVLVLAALQSQALTLEEAMDMAEDNNLRRKVVLKFLPVIFQEDPIARKRFIRGGSVSSGFGSSLHLQYS